MKKDYRWSAHSPSLSGLATKAGFRTVSLLLIFLCFHWHLNAQTHPISGTVTDESGQPLPGVSVVVKGTTTGVTTGAEGKYSLNAESGSTLQFSFIGYAGQEVPAGGRTVIDVTLHEDVQKLDEIVVVGYGTMRKVDLTGTVASVKSGDLANIPVTTAAEAITGKLAGVQVVTTSGEPDAEVKIRVRGGGSITQDNAPLYIIDGFPVDNGLSLVSPSDIERIDILKDASSTAIYGARGANGVVIITTKNGREGQTAVNVDMYWGVKKIAEQIDMMNPYDYVVSAWERTRIEANDLNASSMASFIERYGTFDSFKDRYGNQAGTNWQDEMFRSAVTQNYNLSVSGGNSSTRYNVGLSRIIEEGALLGSSYSRTILNAKLDHKANERLSVGFSTRYNHNTTLGGAVSTQNPLMYRPTEGLAGNLDLSEFDEEYLNENDLINPIILSQEMYRRKVNDNFNIMGDASYKLGDFVLKTQLGIDKYIHKNRSFDGPHTKNARNNAGPLATLTERTTDRWINSNTLSWNKLDIDGKHNVSAMIGQEWSDKRESSLSITSKRFPDYITPEKAFGSMSLGDDVNKPNTQMSSYQLMSFFGRASYDYMGKYLFNATFRADGSSNFAKENRWGYFPSAGAAWRISEEPFMQNVPQVTNLKLRYSFGMAGNDRIESLKWTTIWLTDATTQYGINNSLSPALKPADIANPHIKWETTVSHNVGLDISLFNNRLNVTADFYNNETRDLLLDSALPANAGFSSQFQNIGSTRNRGFEFVVDGSIIRKTDFSLSAGFNISFNRSKVLSLSRNVDQRFESPGITTAGPKNEYIVKVGQPLGQMYGYVYDGWYAADDFVDGSWNAATKMWTLKTDVPYETAYAPRPGDIRFKDMGGSPDANGNPVITDDDKVVIGNANPKHFGGFNVNMRYRNFDLSAFFNWSYGNDVYNATKLNLYNGRAKETNLPAEMVNRFTYIDDAGEPITDLARLGERNRNASMYAPYRGTFVFHSGMVEDGSFLRLNNLTLGYTLPQKLLSKAGIKNLRIYVTGYNLACWTKYSGYDPEVDAYHSNLTTPGIDYFGYPKNRSFIGGINITF